MSDNLPKKPSNILIYQTEDGQTRIDVRLEEKTVWLSQKMMAELFQKDVRTIMNLAYLQAGLVERAIDASPVEDVAVVLTHHFHGHRSR